MILETNIKRDKKGLPTSKPSSYKPTKKEKNRISKILAHFAIGYENMRKPCKEFNDMSVIDRQGLSQASFNGYIPPKSLDPDENWKANTIRPIVRNRIISIAAHTTGSIMYPKIVAQNSDDEEDKDAAMVLSDLFEWAGEQSNYIKTILYSVIASLINPAAIIYTQYAQNYRTIKDILEDGSWKEKQVVDDEYSGFQDVMVPIDELFIADLYEHEIQRQPFLIWRRAIDYSVAETKYGKNDNFKYVTAGIQNIFDAATDTFYNVEDQRLNERLVEEVIYFNRTEDLQCVLVNGVLMTDADQPNPRKDKKYPFVKMGYELFDEGKFFYYRSLAQKLRPDEDVVNNLYNKFFDAAYLQSAPPLAIYGVEAFNSSIMTPNTVTSFESPDVKIQPLSAGQNLQAAIVGIQKAESSISESSNDTLQSGQALEGSQTAFEISQLEQNAKIMLGLFAKMIAFAVKEYGVLRLGDILQFLTVGDIEEISNELSYKSFLIPERINSGTKKSRKIIFDSSLPTELPAETSDDERLNMSFDVLEESGGIDSDKEIYRANPELLRNIKYSVFIRPDLVTPPSDNLKRALNLEEFDRAIRLPFVDQEELARDLLFGSYDQTKGNVDKYIKKQEMPMLGGDVGEQAGVSESGGSSNVMGKIFGNGKSQSLAVKAS